MTNPILNQEAVLLESRAARDSRLGSVSEVQADATLKAQGLMMAYWHSTRVATTAQVAEFYGVPEEAVRQTAKRHRDELESDGLKVLRGKALKEVSDIVSLSPNTPNITLWTPRAALRLGMLLRDSVVAKAIRTALLSTVHQAVIPPVSVEDIGAAVAVASRFFGERYGQRMLHLNLERHYPAIGLPKTEESELAPYAQPDAHLIPTDIARSLGLYDSNGNPSPRKANKLLEELGYQQKVADKWTPIGKGLEHSQRRVVDVGGRTDKDQLVWFPSIIDELKALGY